MSPERAVHRLTGEIARWLGLDAGELTLGARADLVVVDPERLDDALSAYHEEPMPAFGGFTRLVRRNPDAVPQVLINGRLVAERGRLLPGVGERGGHGRFLGAGETARGWAEPALRQAG